MSTGDVPKQSPQTASSRVRRTQLVQFGPIAIRKRQTLAPTLATGRRPKDAVLCGEEQIKRDLRRQKNRESARNLKKIRRDIERKLEAHIEQLGTEQEELLERVNHLRLYKEYLEHRSRQTDYMHNLIVRTAAVVLAELKQKEREEPEREPIAQADVKDETRSQSPQWQLSFHI